MEMEDNSIDQLFSNKLSDFEKAPNASLWKQLQKRKQAKQRRVAIWFSTIAASLVILLLSGIVVWQHLGESSSDMGFAGISTVKEGAAIKYKAYKFKQRVVERVVPKAQPSLPEKSIAVEKKPARSSLTLAKAPQKLKAIKHQAPVIHVQDEAPILSMPIQEVILPESIEHPTNTTVVVINIAEVEEVEASVTPNESQEPLLVNEPQNDHEKKKTKAGRLLQQFKNVKNGEKIDWNEIGLHPENFLALVRPNREHEKTSK
ncbi:MAG: hypothetical protein V4714_01080 [Bacteroidota bacterium]